MAASLDVLMGRPGIDAGRTAAIGYCFGGHCVLQLARSGADIKAAVSFHGLLATQARAEPDSVKGQVSVFTGGLDPHVRPADVAALREELTAAGARWHLTEFGNSYHAFTDPGADTPKAGRQYDPSVDAVSWASTLALLDAAVRPR